MAVQSQKKRAYDLKVRCRPSVCEALKTDGMAKELP